jgi:hypothetical protein
MTRLLRLVLPVSLCGLFTSAAILACHHHPQASATAQVTPQTPNDQPTPTATPPTTTPPSEQPAPPVPPASNEGNPTGDAGVNQYPPPPGTPHAALERKLPGGGSPVLLASQPVAPQGPTGAPPTPGAPSPTPSTPSPGAPSPTPNPAQPGTPPSPGMPPSPTGPSQPGSPTPPPGTPQTPSPGTPSQTPGDAGVGDALTPPVPPISDAGVRIDSGMSPVLQRDAR